MHSFIRFNLEWFRYDNRGSFWIFSTTQWISLILLTLLITGRIVYRMINITSTETEK